MVRDVLVHMSWLADVVSRMRGRARQDAVLPLSAPVRGVDGTMMTEIPIARGTTILANIPACNTNKAVWGEDALEWTPERWLRPLPRSVEEARVPGIYANL